MPTWSLCHALLKVLLTHFDKFIVLQGILHRIIEIQQAKPLAPPNVKFHFFHRGKSPIVRFVFHVPSHSFLSQPPDGVGGVQAGHCQPFSSHVYRVSRHGFLSKIVPWPRRAAACSSSTFTMRWAGERRSSWRPLLQSDRGKNPPPKSPPL